MKQLTVLAGYSNSYTPNMYAPPNTEAVPKLTILAMCLSNAMNKIETRGSKQSFLIKY